MPYQDNSIVQKSLSTLQYGLQKKFQIINNLFICVSQCFSFWFLGISPSGSYCPGCGAQVASNL